MKRGRKSITLKMMEEFIRSHPKDTWAKARKRFPHRARSTFQLARRRVKGLPDYARKNPYHSWKKASAKARAAFLFYRKSGFSQEALKKVFSSFDGDPRRERLIVKFNELCVDAGVLFTHEVDQEQIAWMEERRTLPGNRMY